MSLQRRIVLAVLLSGGTAAALGYGGPAPPAPGSAPAGVAQPSGSLTLDQAVKMAEQRLHARVVKAETERDNGRTVYVLRMLNDAGHVWTVHVDAANGTLI
jgi:uncharacterized membrane protein YkoI